MSTIQQSISTLPSTPIPGSSTFDYDAQQFIAKWPILVSELNSLIAQINVISTEFNTAILQIGMIDTGAILAAAITAASEATKAIEAAGNNIRGIDPEMAPANRDLGTAAYLDQTWINTTITWEAGSIAAGAIKYYDAPVPGVAKEDFAMISSSSAASFVSLGIRLGCEVTGNDTVAIVVHNTTAASITLGSLTYYIRAMKRRPCR